MAHTGKSMSLIFCTLLACSACMESKAEFETVALSVSPATVTRTEAQSPGITLTMAIPKGKHIFSAVQQTVGRKTELRVIGSDRQEIQFDVRWPTATHFHNETLRQDYDIYEGEQPVPVKIVGAAMVNDPVMITLDYILCDVQCVPGQSSLKLTLND